ncbi:hypothetical protein GLOIN_2v1884352 [Rhizophagus irregularis DAOM 181602=DAOM 197198]|nr:hypothetical protein GLOIN_2v1884352 [Rhizophagus irregularis DAOM 181602=DAOM 197198]
MEVDEEEVRAEMKTILKTFPIKLELKYDEKFTIKSWLSALHKYRRVRLLYKQRGTLDKDNCRLHRNNRINETRQVKEYAESDEEQPDGKKHINVYNLSWRSEELIDLLQNVLNQHAFSLQSAQLIRTRNYDDEIYNIISRHLRDAEMSAEMDEIVVIEDSEPMGMEESEPTGVEESEPMGVKESPETEDETDKWYKFVL